MALHDNERNVGGRKASSLMDDAVVLPGSGTGSHEQRRGKGDREEILRDRQGSRARAILVDVIILLLLVGLALGIRTGYHALKNLYSPVWETRTVEFCVEMQGVDMDLVYDEKGNATFMDSGVWYTDQADGDLLGTVVKVDSEREEHGDTVTLYRTVTAEAKYRQGEGYYMGETPLLAGMQGQFRVTGMMGEGTVISLHEKT